MLLRLAISASLMGCLGPIQSSPYHSINTAFNSGKFHFWQDSECYSVLLRQISPPETFVDNRPMQVSKMGAYYYHKSKLSVNRGYHMVMQRYEFYF